MKKYIIITVCIINFLNGMETPDTKSIVPISCKWGKKYYGENYLPIAAAHHYLIQQYSFKNSTVLDLDNNDKYIKESIAQTAHEVDSYRQEFKQYDIVTSFELLDTMSEGLRNNLSKMRDLLKPSGEFIGAVMTQTNVKNCIDLSTVRTMYPKIYEAETATNKSTPYLSEEKLQNIHLLFPTDDDIKKDISDMGYDIIAYTPRTFNIIIKNKEIFKNVMIDDFIETFALSSEKTETLCQEFISLLMMQLQENDEKHLIYPQSITEIHIRKMGK